MQGSEYAYREYRDTQLTIQDGQNYLGSAANIGGIRNIYMPVCTSKLCPPAFLFKDQPSRGAL